MPTSTTRSTSHYLATNRGVLDALVGLQMASRSRGAVADVDLVNIDDDGDDLVDLTDVEAPLEAPITPGILVPAG